MTNKDEQLIAEYMCNVCKKIKPQNEIERFDLLKRVEDLRVEIYDLEDEGFADLSAVFQKTIKVMQEKR